MTRFTIDKVGWHTKTPGNTESRESVINRFYQIALFLDQNELTIKKIYVDYASIDDEFQICSDNLSDVGLELLKNSYDKWLRKVDKGMNSSDVSLLERELKKIRSRMN